MYIGLVTKSRYKKLADKIKLMFLVICKVGEGVIMEDEGCEVFLND